MRHHLLLTPLFLGSLLVVGCGQEELPPEAESVQADDSAIINGTPDGTHTAVVAVLGPDFACTGTVLQVKGTTGYVLTAAHCCPANDLPDQVFVGTDYNAPNTGTYYNVVAGSVVKDSCYLDYPGSTDDVCMLKFKDATGVPTIPPMTPQTDTLSIGTPITYVGYGITSAPPGGNNSVRRKVDKTVGKVDAYFVEYAGAGQSGTCQGDSGGPGIVTVNGQEMVAGVVSFGDQSCNQLGSSIRTSAVYTNFIAVYLADGVPAPVCPAAVDCNSCVQSSTQNGACKNITEACFKDADCAALAQCYQACTTTACQNACTTANVDGLTKYAAIFGCICTVGCAQACGNTATCTAPKCGLKVVDTTCTSCVETTCCAEAWECQSDATCKKCFTVGTPPAACAASAKAAAYYACASSQCSCTVKDPSLAGGTTASSSAATTGSGETTTSGAGGDPGTTVTAAGVGGGAATTAGSGTGGSGSNDDTTVGGCACSTEDRGQGGTTPYAALVLGALGIVARRRRRAK